MDDKQSLCQVGGCCTRPELCLFSKGCPLPTRRGKREADPCVPCGHSFRRKKTCFADTQLCQIVIDEQHFRHGNSDWTSRPLCKRKGLLPPGAWSSRPMHSVAGCNGREARAQLPTNLRARDPARTPAVHRVRKREDGFLLPD